VLCCLAALASEANTTHVAVAANFTDAANEIAARFAERTDHSAVLSFGSSGQLLAQIANGAPFDVFLSADQKYAERAVTRKLARGATRFTYAIGSVVLYSRDTDLVQDEQTLRDGRFDRIAIANPTIAPYGSAAVEVMRTLGVYDRLQGKIVQGGNIAQTFRFVDTGNAELGFVALSQVIGTNTGSRWTIPQSLYTPIRQDVVLLNKGAGNPAARAFLDFLKSREVIAIIESYGYRAAE
jgi:molybdate transport system substrate-binding protein